MVIGYGRLQKEMTMIYKLSHPNEVDEELQKELDDIGGDING